jgi:hypothetical protein
MQHPTKTRAILVAAAVIAAAGAFATALGEEMASQNTPTVLSGKMTVGETATTTTGAPTEVPTPVAQPALKADIPCGFTSGC